MAAGRRPVGRIFEDVAEVVVVASVTLAVWQTENYFAFSEGVRSFYMQKVSMKTLIQGKSMYAAWTCGALLLPCVEVSGCLPANRCEPFASQQIVAHGNLPAYANPYEPLKLSHESSHLHASRCRLAANRFRVRGKQRSRQGFALCSGPRAARRFAVRRIGRHCTASSLNID